MHTFRKTWLVLMGAILLVTLSVSAAFGAKPDAAAEGNRGQTVASFVHELVFGLDEETDEETEQEEDEDVDEDLDEDTDEDLDEDSDEDSEDVEGSEERATGAEHGACVSEEASSKEDETEADGNHGAVVSLAARETCWEPAEADEATEGEEDTEEASDEEDESDLTSAQEQRKADREAARAEKKAARAEARAAARADRVSAKAARAEARALRQAANAERHAARTGATAAGGHGRGR
jgi:hypothetical protein